MTLRSSKVGSFLIASVMLVASAGAARARAGGTITGTITTREAAGRPIRVTIDQAVCGTSLPDESVVVDATGHLANAVVTVSGVKSPAPADAVVTNEKCRFEPRVSTLRPNGTVKMSSKDAVLHTMHAAGGDGRALFNVSLPLPNMTLSRPVDAPGAVTLSCSTHTWMRGYLYVTDELAAISGPGGKFRIDGVPAGTVELRFWHETLKSPPVKVVVKDGATVSVDFVAVR
jgi:plastocyanin